MISLAVKKIMVESFGGVDCADDASLRVNFAGSKLRTSNESSILVVGCKYVFACLLSASQ